MLPQVLQHRYFITVYVAPPGRGSGADDSFFVCFYVDDGVSVEVQQYPLGDRCLCASASLVSDHFRLFGNRAPTDPPLLSKHKISHWDTQLKVLGWEIDSVAMTISLTKAKVAKLRGSSSSGRGAVGMH